MTLGKRIQWVLIFTSLAVFTFSVVSNATGVTANKVLADTIRDDQYLKTQSKFLVVGGDVQEESKIVSRLNKFVEKDKLCSLTEEQYNALASQYQLNTDTLDVDGNSVTVVTIGGDETKPGELKAIIGENCKVLKTKNLFYMVAGFQIS